MIVHKAIYLTLSQMINLGSLWGWYVQELVFDNRSTKSLNPFT